MKKLNKLALRRMESKELSQRQMDQVRGGGNLCGCACCYEGNGGSSQADNHLANCRSNLISYNCPDGGIGNWVANGC